MTINKKIILWSVIGLILASTIVYVLLMKTDRIVDKTEKNSGNNNLMQNECLQNSDCASCGTGCASKEIASQDTCHVGLNDNHCVCSSNKCIIEPKIKPSADQVECKIENKDYPYYVKNGGKIYTYSKVVVADTEFSDYNNFTVKSLSFGYGSGPELYTTEPLGVKMKSKDGAILADITYSDPRGRVLFCEMGMRCPPPEFLNEGRALFIFSLFESYKQKAVSDYVNTRNTALIEVYERETLPKYAKSYDNYKPGTLLLKLDISECSEKFCQTVAEPNDPSCKK